MYIMGCMEYEGREKTQSYITKGNKYSNKPHDSSSFINHQQVKYFIQAKPLISHQQYQEGITP
jgi:hypothetical protein